MTTHIDPCDLVAYGRGQLSRAQATHVREHAFHCSACGDQLAAVLLLREGALIADQPVAEVVDFPVSARRAPNALRWASAAAAMLLVAFGAYLYSGSMATDPAVPTAISGAPMPSSTVADFDLAYVPVTPAEAELAQGFARFVAEFNGIPVTRAAADLVASDAELIGHGIDALRMGLPSEAARVLEPFAGREASLGTLIYGLALYFEQERPAAAISAFEEYLRVAFDRPPAEWHANEAAAAYYLSRLYAARGDLDASRSLALNVLETGDRAVQFRQATDQLLSELDQARE